MERVPENICKPPTSQLYQINVVILEGRHLAIKNSNTKVNISIGKRKKTIHARSNKTDCPHYNDHCVFRFRLPLNVLLDEILTIRVYELSVIRKLVGSFSVDLTTVWSQPNHQFYHKWAVLMDPKNHAGRGPRGFLKCDIAILSRDVVLKPPNEGEVGVLEQNLLVPYGGTPDRKRTRIVLSVFRGDGFSYYSGNRRLKLSQPYIKITYGGSTGKTSVAKNKGPPVWNEELTFLDFFPPLTQNILVEIFDKQKPYRKSLANTNIDIRTLYEDGKNGFLPTFGPNFLYLYRPLKKFERHRNSCPLQNSFTYMGRVLLALRTEVIESQQKNKQKKHKIVPKPIPPLIERVYFEYKKFILFAAIFDALFFDSKLSRKNINIRVTLGPKKNLTESKIGHGSKAKRHSEGETPKHLTVLTDCNTTKKHKPIGKGNYSFITFPGIFPCVHVYGEWPDSLRRIYCSNVIKKVIQNCTDEINKIKYDLQFETEQRSSQKLKTTLANLSKSCEVILPLTNTTKLEDTNISRQRKWVYHKEIADIAQKAKIASNQNALKTEDELRKISTYLARLTKYAQDPENSFPDTEIWLLRHNKEVAQYKIRTEDVTFSTDFNNRGVMSGKTQTILLRGKKGQLKAKLDIFVWFGLADDFVECLKMLPDGLSKNHLPCSSRSIMKIPSQLIYEEKHHFQCRVHIFQGKIFYGFDKTGLAHPLARAIILGHNKTTQIRKCTRGPIWDETLVFPVVTLFGPSKYIKENPVSVTVEVFNRGLHPSELIGRTFVTPMIKLKDDKYEPPDFPPKLIWRSLHSEQKEVGEVLIATELLEHSDNFKDLFGALSSPLQIPENVRTRKVRYRLEILFWGIRYLKRKGRLKKNMFMASEFGEKLIKSSVLHKVRGTLNFNDPVQFVEVELPEEPEYAPPFSLALCQMGPVSHKKRCIGTCFLPNVRYFLINLIKSESAGEAIRLQVREDLKNTQTKGKFPRDSIFLPSKSHLQAARKLFKKYEAPNHELETITEEEKNSWWLRFNASEETSEYPGVPKLKIYQGELEAQPEFKEFQDFLHSFYLVKGPKKKNGEPILMAKVKAVVALYKCSPEIMKSDKTIIKNAPSNAPLKFVLRVYLICAKNLAPKDVYGKADPYIYLQLGEQRVSGRNSYYPKQINPTFGMCYELKGTFPNDSVLCIKVIDHSAHSHDDLIGETTIDIENRYYSKYHATCGLPQTFGNQGFSFWRDIYLPSEILKMLCVESNLNGPIYKKNGVVIEGYEFATPESPHTSEAVKVEEAQALSVLNRWHELPLFGYHLVPEHVETRSLYHPDIPGIEQGKLQLWVDIFPDAGSMPPKVDITLHPPVAMELRAIIWNVVDVVLDDKSLLVNERVSDIYLKGWILSLEEETQKTDIHYKSLNGKGNFNWRFIFHFNYIPSERKIIIRKKGNAFDKYPEERKLHCKLEIQIWDNDAFGDDYLGTLILELCSMPRGANLSSRCTLKMLAPNAGKINLFKIKRTRGWWPCRRLKMKETMGNEFELTGKIDLELEILTEAEAKQSPAGKGREEPHALPPPKRSAASQKWLLNPIKILRKVFLRKRLQVLLICLLLVLVAAFILAATKAILNFGLKRLLGA